MTGHSHSLSLCTTPTSHSLLCNSGGYHTGLNLVLKINIFMLTLANRSCRILFHLGLPLAVVNKLLMHIEQTGLFSALRKVCSGSQNVCSPAVNAFLVWQGLFPVIRWMDRAHTKRAISKVLPGRRLIVFTCSIYL